MRSDRVVIRLSLPHKALSPNARVHWAAKAKAAKAARHDARWLAIEAWGRVAPRHDAPRWARARIDVRAFYKRKHGHGVDRDNLVASLKSAADGLQDAGMIANDNGVEWGEVEIAYGTDDPRIEITVEHLEK